MNSIFSLSRGSPMIILSICLLWMISFQCSLFVVESKSLSNVPISSLYQKPGGFTLFYPKIREKDFLEDSINNKNDLESNEESEEMKNDFSDVQMLPTKKQQVLLEEKLMDGYDSKRIQFLIHKIFSSFHYISKKNYKILITNDKKLVFSMRSWVFGWNHFPFRIVTTTTTTTNDTNSNDEKIIVDLISLNGHKHLQEYMGRIEIFKSKSKSFLSKTSKESTVMRILLHHSQTSFISKRKLKNIFQTLSLHIQELFTENHHLFDIRQHQKAQYQQVCKEMDAKKKQEVLDKILHPEKYKKKRAPLNTDGSNRYTPSAATQARRQVKRGG